MNINDVIKWWWHSDIGWDTTEYIGIIVGKEKVLDELTGQYIRVFTVLEPNGELITVREDTKLELVA